MIDNSLDINVRASAGYNIPTGNLRTHHGSGFAVDEYCPRSCANTPAVWVLVRTWMRNNTRPHERHRRPVNEDVR